MTAVTVQQHECVDSREYHTKVQLTEVLCESSIGGTMGAIGEVILALPGVCTVFVSRYSVTVRKGVAWSWDEVEPAILEFLGAME